MTQVRAVERGAPWTSRLTVETFRAVDIFELVHEGVIRPRLLPHERMLPRVEQERRQCERVERDMLVAAGLDPRVAAEVEGNLETYTGLNNMLRLLIGTTVGSGGTNYANGTARLCVGTGGGSVPTAAVTDTDLTATTGASNRWNQACDSSYPAVPNGGNNSAAAVATAVGTVSTSNGNFAWNEWGMDSGGSSGTGACSGLFNHRGVALLTKSSSVAAALTATFTQS